MIISLVIIAVSMSAKVDEQKQINTKQEARIESLDNRMDTTERNDIVFNNAVQNINQNVERIDTRQSRMEGVVQDQTGTLREILIQLKNDRRENRENMGRR